MFFFFKQKTAYEIYQCDWSSDVCSSDLISTACRVGVVTTALKSVFAVLARQAHDAKLAEFKIGRASCRERV